MNREDFPILSSDIIYFDNSATTLKPISFIEKTVDYYSNYSANAHRGDYDISLKVDDAINSTRLLIKEFINAKKDSEIVFTSGTTDSLNKVIFGYFKKYLQSSDEIIISKMEHAALVLPLFELQSLIGFKINYVELNHDNEVTIDNIKKIVTENTKLIALSHVTNSIGDVRPIKEITEFAHNKNILVLVDAAQSIPHIKTDVQDLNIDFLAFSAHKMLGPTGLGILYGKESLLRNIDPLVFGGGMNTTFKSDGFKKYHDLPSVLEAGTLNISAIIAFGESIKYINNIGLEVIHNYELDLKKYALSKLKNNPNIDIINPNIQSGIILLNYKDIFAQDLAVYLNKHKICVRAGNHCAKMVEEVINYKNTVRISFYLYNTKEEIDYLVKVLENPNIKREII